MLQPAEADRVFQPCIYESTISERLFLVEIWLDGDSPIQIWGESPAAVFSHPHTLSRTFLGQHLVLIGLLSNMDVLARCVNQRHLGRGTPQQQIWTQAGDYFHHVQRRPSLILNIALVYKIYLTLVCNLYFIRNCQCLSNFSSNLICVLLPFSLCLPKIILGFLDTERWSSKLILKQHTAE